MKIEAFGVEQWMNAWETKCAYNVAETCVESITVEELLKMAGVTPDQVERIRHTLQYAYLIPGEAGKEAPAVRSAGQPRRFGDKPVR